MIRIIQPSNMMSTDDTAQNKTSPSATTALMWLCPIAIAELLGQDVGCIQGTISPYSFQLCGFLCTVFIPMFPPAQFDMDLYRCGC